MKIKQELRQRDKDDFNAVGKYASNKYYVNQDKKDTAIMDRKGGARLLAEDLRQKEQHKYQTKMEERKAAAEKRMQELVKLDESKKKEKDDIKAGKAKLR